MLDHDAIFDRYLAAMLNGGAESPEAFLRREGVAPDPELLSLLGGLYRERARSDDEPARRIGDFALIRRIGHGGMGEVYEARQESLGRRVALKLIGRELAGSPVATARFDREARAAAKLRHPGIVTVHAVGEDRGTRYIAMELVEGTALDEVLAESRAGIGFERVLGWIGQLARALDYAHTKGVVHRDVKPSNILITPDDRPMLVDFGLAREIDAAGATLSEGFAGSPFYAAPEQIGRGGGAADGRTDVYSLGVVMYQCLSGRVPFDPGTLEQVLQSILADEPPPPRSINASIPRDVELVALKAMEKDPARRYATAGAFADDVEAILSNRPVSVRASGRVERAIKWAKRNPAQAAIAASALGAVIVIIGVLGGNQIAQARAKRMASDAAITEARRLVDSMSAEFQERRALEAEFESLSSGRIGRYYTDEEDRKLFAMETDVQRARRRREQSQLHVLDLTDRAVRLGADPDTVAAIRGKLYFERFLEAEAQGDSAGQFVYRGLAEANDPTGELARAVRATGQVTLTTDPPGASVHIFRRRLLSELVDGGEPRLILVPFREASAPRFAEAWALRVVRGSGDLRAGDHIFEIAGEPIRDCVLVAEVGAGSPAETAGVRRFDRLIRAGDASVKDDWDIDEQLSPRGAKDANFVFRRGMEELVVSAPSYAALGVIAATPAEIARRGGASATVRRSGEFETILLPAGLDVRSTAAPAPAVQSSHGGSTPLQLQLEAGDYMALVQLAGHESVRCRIELWRGGSSRVHIRLCTEGTTPDGFVYIADCPNIVKPQLPFWIMEREVTMAEYFEFLNDPETLAEVDRSSTPIRFPRDEEFPRGVRAANGKFLVPETWNPAWPALNVSWHDAKSYAAWKTRRARAAGRPETYDLPDDSEWEISAANPLGYGYPMGNFRHKWVCSCRSRPRPDPEPVLRYPIDESCLGVFDMCGGVSEWTRSIWRAGTEYYHYAGGSWGVSIPRDFSVYGGNGALPDRTSGIIGFRLVMRREEPRP